MSTHVNYDNIRSLLMGVGNNLATKIADIDLTDQQKSQLALIDKILKSGDGSKYLSDNGTYKNIPLDKIQNMVNNLGVIYDLLKISYNITEKWDNTGIVQSPVARNSNGCVEYNGKIYCIGGSTIGDTIGVNINRTDIYNISSNTWTTGLAIPTARESFVCIQYYGKIYCLGGRIPNGPSNKADVYDISTNTWATLASLPTAMGWFNGIVYNNKIYCIGGSSASGCDNKVQIYDILSNTWSYGTALPSIRNSANCILYNGMIYTMGGFNGTNTLKSLSIYNILSNTWTSGVDMLTAKDDFGCVLYGKKIYTIGGAYHTQSSTSIYNKVEIYDIENNIWTSDANSMPISSSYFQAVIYDNNIYCIGGYTGSVSLNSFNILHLIYSSYNINIPQSIFDKLSILITNGIGNKILTDNGTYQEYIPSGYRELTVDELNALSSDIKSSFII